MTAAREVLRLLAEHGWTLAVAESLTGGLVAAELAAVPGASRSFRGSVTAYATALKHEILGVDAALLAARGAVDAEVARQMAAGVRDRLGADWGISTTGVAGPDPQDGKPVGTVFVAVAGPVPAGGAGAMAAPAPAGWPAAGAEGVESAGTVVAVELSLTGDRTAIRDASVAAVLELLAARLRRSTVAHPGFGQSL
ncbi:CinA family protein [Actinacidiphila sp. ITFR-21]|uniref:CinA family protein n=1 Tax=Actinacidiphila sp. ITFR-21 TaxID=3075199 RepID=UPI00288AD718|nr:nicotinamide-nucleotide amidohydrolase family protein [Streptomyces sp. ITFR-21]WNI18366.1 nicotinamide-nucleotide amidohydrolase family protein [Streptomyces sp. ITFR-21]